MQLILDPTFIINSKLNFNEIRSLYEKQIFNNEKKVSSKKLEPKARLFYRQFQYTYDTW